MSLIQSGLHPLAPASCMLLGTHCTKRAGSGLNAVRQVGRCSPPLICRSSNVEVLRLAGIEQPSYKLGQDPDAAVARAGLFQVAEVAL